MSTAERRNEIISILTVRHHITTKELAGEFGVSIGTIKKRYSASIFCMRQRGISLIVILPDYPVNLE